MKTVLVTALVGAITQAPAAPAGIQRVAWLQGCWESSSAGRTVEEQWMAPRGGSMLGMGRTVRGGALVEYELVVIKEQGDRLVYEAHPSGQPTATFPSRTIAEASVVFENLQHDFPQRVGYQRNGASALLAWIEGMQGGQIRRIDFSYRRVACGE